jgi:predicted transcriptional regulator
MIQALQALRELDWIEEREDKGAGFDRAGKILALKNPYEVDRKALRKMTIRD